MERWAERGNKSGGRYTGRVKRKRDGNKKGKELEIKRIGRGGGGQRQAEKSEEGVTELPQRACTPRKARETERWMEIDKLMYALPPPPQTHRLPCPGYLWLVCRFVTCFVVAALREQGAGGSPVAAREVSHARLQEGWVQDLVWFGLVCFDLFVKMKEYGVSCEFFR